MWVPTFVKSGGTRVGRGESRESLAITMLKGESRKSLEIQEARKKSLGNPWGYRKDGRGCRMSLRHPE